MLSGQASQSSPRGFCDSVYRKQMMRALGLGLVSIMLAACTNNAGSPAPVRNLNDSGTLTGSSVSAGQTYTVKPGDSLRKISTTTGVDEGVIIRLNGISNPNNIKVGQVLRLSDKADNNIGAAPVASSSKPVARPLDAPPPSDAGASKASDGPVTRAPDAAAVNLMWPANGSVIQGYSATTKGIDIAGNVGDPVVAAASGKVVYAGNGIRGLGNLVILQHDNGFITAYAHNKTLLVKTEQSVSKGSKIAELGQSDATSPRLHFEVRRQNSPVDPMQYLPVK